MSLLQDYVLISLILADHWKLLYCLKGYPPVKLSDVKDEWEKVCFVL